MNYETAVKQVRSSKKPESYMTIRLFYGDKILVPQKVGLAFLEALANAESMQGHFYKGDIPKIKQLDSESVRVDVLSQEEYENLKVAQLLNVSLSDLLASKEEKKST